MSSTITPFQEPDDGALIVRLRAGDPSALRLLMTRYDRLVRFAAFRCHRAAAMRDPHWVDDISGRTWSALSAILRSSAELSVNNLPAWLVRVARNQAISQGRADLSALAPQGMAGVGVAPHDFRGSEELDPGRLVEELEQVEMLKYHLDRLLGHDRAMASQIGLIADRKWREAANALGWTESTLRSRWKVVLEELQRKML